MKAIWNGEFIAQSDQTISVENNHYFPIDSVDKKYLKDSSAHTSCPWKGEASYYTLVVNGKENKDAAWFYPQPKDAAKRIKNYVAFWKGVVISN